MKRKPMLFESITGTNFHRGREVIGLIGTHHGTGVTHTGLMLAFYMGTERGKKTALLECNMQNDMKRLQEVYDWRSESDESFSFRHITCYPGVSHGKISTILNEDYECIIMDFGTDFRNNQEEFLRCSVKLVIGGKAEWELPKLLGFYNAVKEIRGSKAWMYYIPRASDKVITRIRTEADIRVWGVPTNDEPVVPSQTTNRFFRRFF